jgi:hypothetical protein
VTVSGDMVGTGGTDGKCVMTAGIGEMGGSGGMVDSGGGGCTYYDVGMWVYAVGGATG